ncbi:MAG: flavin reductase family protein [Flavobacteriaceae bacterium]
MYYDAVRNDHGLPHDPFKALVVPRPIGWITSQDAQGRINLAPYSFFNCFATNPHIVGFSSQSWKDSVANIGETGEFVCNLATWDLQRQMNQTSAGVGHGVNEMELAGLEAAASVAVKPPRVAATPVAFECRHLRTIELEGLDGRSANAWLVLGQVVGVHLDESLIVDGLVDITRARPIARLGYFDYSVVDEVFEIRRPAGAGSAT